MAYFAGSLAAGLARPPTPLRPALPAPPPASVAVQHSPAPPPSPAPVRLDPRMAQPAVFRTAPRLRPARRSRSELQCLTAAVYYESRGEPLAGQAAVAQVVLNRVRSPAFPHSVCGVVYQGVGSGTCQFTFACDGAADRRRNPGAWRRAEFVARRALDGYVMRRVGGATNYHTVSSRADWSRDMVRVAQVGQHVFFAEGRASDRRDLMRVRLAERRPAPSTELAAAGSADPTRRAAATLEVAAPRQTTLVLAQDAQSSS